MPEVDAPDGSGCLGLLGAGVFCLGLVPDVEGVGILEVVYVLGSVSEGVAGASGGCFCSQCCGGSYWLEPWH